MSEPQTIPLDTLANSYAARWSAARPALEADRPPRRTELRGAIEGNEIFFSLMEMLPDHSRSGINE